MRPVLWFSAAVAALFVSGAARAADVSAVIQACDRTEGCGYTINGAGDISGCSSETCFYCPNDSSRECFQVPERVVSGTPKPMAGPDNLLTNMGASPVPTKKPKLDKGAIVPVAPAAPAISQ